MFLDPFCDTVFVVAATDIFSRLLYFFDGIAYSHAYATVHYHFKIVYVVAESCDLIRTDTIISGNSPERSPLGNILPPMLYRSSPV